MSLSVLVTWSLRRDDSAEQMPGDRHTHTHTLPSWWADLGVILSLPCPEAATAHQGMSLEDPTAEATPEAILGGALLV